MRLIAFLVCAAIFVAVVTADQSLDEQWQQYKTKFGKTYPNAQQDADHKQIFAANLKKIDAHNKLYNEGKVTWKMGVNQFTDMKSDELPKGLKMP